MSVETLKKEIPCNVIPPMTSDLGKYWDQPDTESILIDDTHALMASEALQQLKDYSHSQPTGAYHGKMWKRKYERASEDKGYESGWILCWFGESVNEGYLTNNYREIILLADSKTAEKMGVLKMSLKGWYKNREIYYSARYGDHGGSSNYRYWWLYYCAWLKEHLKD